MSYKVCRTLYTAVLLREESNQQFLQLHFDTFGAACIGIEG